MHGFIHGSILYYTLYILTFKIKVLLILSIRIILRIRISTFKDKYINDLKDNCKLTNLTA